MWIRSQNNYILANVNSIRICRCELDGCAYYSIHGHYDRYEQSLGYYSTKEKALKVLNEIQNVILKGKAYSSTRGINERHTITNERVAIYQMPADEDVKV